MLVRALGERRCGNHLAQQLVRDHTSWTVTQGAYQHLPHAPRRTPTSPTEWDRVLVAVKHPLPWLASMLRWRDTGPGGRMDWRLLADLWTSKYHNWLTHFGSPGEHEHVVWARYEDYVDAPARTAQTWLEDLGADVSVEGVRLRSRHLSPATRDQEGAFDLSYYQERGWWGELPQGAVRAVRQWFAYEMARSVHDELYPEARFEDWLKA